MPFDPRLLIVVQAFVGGYTINVVFPLIDIRKHELGTRYTLYVISMV